MSSATPQNHSPFRSPIKIQKLPNIAFYNLVGIRFQNNLSWHKYVHLYVSQVWHNLDYTSHFVAASPPMIILKLFHDLLTPKVKQEARPSFTNLLCTAKHTGPFILSALMFPVSPDCGIVFPPMFSLSVQPAVFQVPNQHVGRSLS